MVKFHTQEETDVDVLEMILEEVGNQSQLVVYNDDHNNSNYNHYYYSIFSIDDILVDREKLNPLSWLN